MNAAAVGELRITVCEFVGGGSICKLEAWKTMREPHERLPKPWTGATDFTSGAEEMPAECFAIAKAKVKKALDDV